MSHLPNAIINPFKPYLAILNHFTLYAVHYKNGILMGEEKGNTLPSMNKNIKNTIKYFLGIYSRKNSMLIADTEKKS